MILLDLPFMARPALAGCDPETLYHALGRPDRIAFHQGGDDLGAAVEAEAVHGHHTARVRILKARAAALGRRILKLYHYQQVTALLQPPWAT